ncbi:hypothetical protein D3C79_837430 [compost metagenome]
MITVAQQADAIRAGDPGTSTFHHLAHDPATNAFAVFRLGRRIGFGDQYVAIGQHIEPARMVQAVGERGDLRARRRDRRAALWPADGGGDVDGRDQGLVRFRQLR